MLPLLIKLNVLTWGSVQSIDPERLAHGYHAYKFACFR